MSSQIEPVRLLLELTPGRDPVEGSISGPREQQPFTGWIELVSAIETALADASADPATAITEQEG